MENSNKGDGKSPTVVAFENQIKSLAAEFMAIKENIAETAVAKFEAKPSAGEAQNLLRIAHIFTKKSRAKFAEQLGKAQTAYATVTAQSKAAPLTAPKAQRKAILSKLKNLADQINALSAKTN